MMIQQVIQGKVCDIHTRVIISPTNRTFNNKPMKHIASKSSKSIAYIDDDYYCGECAEDDLKKLIT